MLPLFKPLHQHGFVVLAVAMRGAGDNAAGQTLGLNEALDVKAAVEYSAGVPMWMASGSP